MGYFLENREVPILQKLTRPMAEKQFAMTEHFLPVGISREAKNIFLCDLCVSVVSPSMFVHPLNQITSDRAVWAHVVTEAARRAEARSNHRLTILSPIEGRATQDLDAGRFASIQAHTLICFHFQRDSFSAPHPLG